MAVTGPNHRLVVDYPPPGAPRHRFVVSERSEPKRTDTRLSGQVAAAKDVLTNRPRTLFSGVSVTGAGRIARNWCPGWG